MFQPQAFKMSIEKSVAESSSFIGISQKFVFLNYKFNDYRV